MENIITQQQQQQTEKCNFIHTPKLKKKIIKILNEFLIGKYGEFYLNKLIKNQIFDKLLTFDFELVFVFLILTAFIYFFQFFLHG